MSPAHPEFQLDAISAAIIETLQKDGRRSYASIGKEVALSEAAVRQRVQKLIDGGRHADRGGDRPAAARLRPPGDGRPQGDRRPRAHRRRARRDRRGRPTWCLTAGNFDLLAEVVCESDEHLLDLISNQIRGIPGVVGTETLVYLKTAKQTYDEGVRLP